MLEIAEQQPQHIAPNERFTECHGTPTGGGCCFLIQIILASIGSPSKKSPKWASELPTKDPPWTEVRPLALKSYENSG